MKRILVTGGAGFIGSHLCQRLHDEGHFVFCLDNLYSGNSSYISHLLISDRFQFIHQSVIEPFDIAVDQIYHLACPASPVHYQKDPLFTLDTNYFGAKNVLQLAKKYKATVLLTSTSEVYGDPLIHPQQEDYFGNVNPIGIRSCYDEGKRISETMFFDHHRMFQTDIKVARIFNTYGPNMNKEDGRVISNFVVQALTNEPITVYGEGNQTRSFCYVDDMVEGLVLLMNSPGTILGPINLGNPIEQRVVDVAKLIIQSTKSKSELAFQGLPEDDPKLRQPDITKATTLLSWRPKVSFDLGLQKTIEYFKGVV
jgi:UDP-glucuronate decarboxylase